MASYASRREHFNQYVKIASKGKVDAGFVFATGKTLLVCHDCGEELSFMEPDDPTSIDNSVQDWVRMHAHTGHRPNWVNSNWGKPDFSPLGTVGDKPDAAQKIADMQSDLSHSKEFLKQYQLEKEKLSKDQILEDLKHDNSLKIQMLKIAALERIAQRTPDIVVKRVTPKPSEALRVKEGRKFR